MFAVLRQTSRISVRCTVLDINRYAGIRHLNEHIWRPHERNLQTARLKKQTPPMRHMEKRAGRRVNMSNIQSQSALVQLCAGVQQLQTIFGVCKLPHNTTYTINKSQKSLCLHTTHAESIQIVNRKIGWIDSSTARTHALVNVPHSARSPVESRPFSLFVIQNGCFVIDQIDRWNTQRFDR